MRIPQHFRYLNPILEVLRDLGGSGRAGEVVDLVIEKLGISEEELEIKIKSGPSRVKNQIQWARLLLAKTDHIDSSERGVWTLTEKGMKASFSDLDLLNLYDCRKEWNKQHRQKKRTAFVDDPEMKETNEDDLIGEGGYREALLGILRALPPSGFERLCQRLLRESGFEQVTVTGKSGDGGIDGVGILQVNPFVSFNVLFQCKRYQGTVAPTHVRDFRGAMLGRADKGIIMTTGQFSFDAKKEARRDGVPPIELVDGEKMIDMFEHLEIGLKPIKTYEIDEKFFEEFRD
ncbi:MAG: restriction endonuclease [Desulfatitalea sp. BRH_c12]|nr:MAG: restriction endonuclease [Desulfatitalea sp. BRH_c12]